MRAVVYSDSPDRVRLASVETPVPAPGEVLVRVIAAAVNPLDWRLASGKAFMRKIARRKAKSNVDRPGVDLAGVVEAVGPSVVRFRVGDEVFGCAHGAFAEHVNAKESQLALKPRNVSFEDAAALPVAALTALQAFRDKAHLQTGRSVLINGAAGGVGTYAVQIAKSIGADVTGVCSARNSEMVRSLGADRVVDYAQQDFAQASTRYDVVLDNVGNRSYSDLLRVLKPGGIIVVAGAPKTVGAIVAFVAEAKLRSFLLRQNIVFFVANVNGSDLATLAEMLESGKMHSVIDCRYPLSEVPAALRYSSEGHARAKIVIEIGSFPRPGRS